MIPTALLPGSIVDASTAVVGVSVGAPDRIRCCCPDNLAPASPSPSLPPPTLKPLGIVAGPDIRATACSAHPHAVRASLAWSTSRAMSFKARPTYKDTVMALLKARGPGTFNMPVNGRTPLIEDAVQGHLDFVELLVQAGVKTDTPDAPRWRGRGNVVGRARNRRRLSAPPQRLGWEVGPSVGAVGVEGGFVGRAVLRSNEGSCLPHLAAVENGHVIRNMTLNTSRKPDRTARKDRLLSL